MFSKLSEALASPVSVVTGWWLIAARRVHGELSYLERRGRRVYPELSVDLIISPFVLCSMP